MIDTMLGKGKAEPEKIRFNAEIAGTRRGTQSKEIIRHRELSAAEPHQSRQPPQIQDKQMHSGSIEPGAMRT